jgi:hypothetical protein
MILKGTDTSAEPVYKVVNQSIGGGNISVKTK